MLEPVGDPRAEDRFAVGDGADRAERLVLCGSLELVAACAGSDGGEHGLVIVVHRHHEDVDAFRLAEDAAGGVDAVEAGHVDIHHDDVRSERQRDLDGLLACRSLSDDLGVGDRFEESTKPCSEERVVVGDEDSDRRVHHAVSAAGRRGRDATTSVPPPVLSPISQVPPISAARSFIECSPIPLDPIERPVSVVGDLEPQRRRFNGNANAAGLRVCVPFDVRQRLLGDPVGSNLDCGGERGHRARSVDRDGRFPRGLLRCQTAKRGCQPELVERWRPQPVNEPADVSDHRLDLLGGGDEQFVGALKIGAAEVADGLEGEREPGKRRAEAVVQVATDAPALLFAKLDDALSRQLQLLRETDCVDRGGDLGCEVGDQAVVALPQALASACCDPELADARCPGGRGGT